MSNIILNRAWTSTVDSPTDMAVLVSLADQANDDGICWPSVGSISRRTRLSERAVRVALRRLQSAHHVSLTGHTAGGAPGQTPTYVVHPVQAETGAGNAGGQHMPPSTGAAGAGDGGSRCRGRGQQVPPNHHRTISEPSEEALRAAHSSPSHDSPTAESVECDLIPFPNSGVSAKSKKGGAPADVIGWDGAAFSVSEAWRARMASAFPGVNIEGELLAAANWLAGAPASRRKADHGRFLLNWLKRARPAAAGRYEPAAEFHPPAEIEDAPAGWERAYERRYGDPPDRSWHFLIPDVQQELRADLNKKPA